MHADARYQNRVTAWLAAKVHSERTPTLLLRGKLVLQLIDWLGGDLILISNFSRPLWLLIELSNAT
jgi:hypothetical protein